MIGFVDNTSSSTNDFDSPVLLPISHYAALAEKDAQVWNDVLYLTGAALNKKSVPITTFTLFSP